MRKGRVRVGRARWGERAWGAGGGRGGWDAIGASEIEIALETRRRTDAAGAAAAGAAPKVGVAGAAPPKGCEGRRARSGGGGGGGRVSGPGGWVPRRDVRSRAFKKPRPGTPGGARPARPRARTEAPPPPNIGIGSPLPPRCHRRDLSPARANERAVVECGTPAPHANFVGAGGAASSSQRLRPHRLATTRVSRTARADAAGVIIADTRGCSDRKHPPPRSRKNNRRRRFPARWWFRFFRVEGATRGPFPTAPRASRRRTEGNPFRDAARRLRHVRRGQRHDRRSA